VTTCSAGYFDTDNVHSNGCECQADTHGDTCAAPTNMGTVSDGVTRMQTGNLVGPADEDWFVVTLTPSASCGFLPTVTISNGGLPIVFNVYSGCAGASPTGSLACTLEGGNSASGNFTTWEFRNASPGGFGGNVTCGDLQGMDPTPAVGSFYTSPTTLYIRVRRTASSASCLPYTLTVTS